MKKLLFILVFMIAINSAYSQVEKGFFGVLESRGSSGDMANLKNKGFRPCEFAIGVGYNFCPRFSLRANTEEAIALFKENGVKSYENNGLLGLACGYNAINSKKTLLEISAAAGNTLGGDWNYTYYDFGIRFSISNKELCRNKLFEGIGIRFYDSHKAALKNRLSIYATIGFRIN